MNMPNTFIHSLYIFALLFQVWDFYKEYYDDHFFTMSPGVHIHNYSGVNI